MKFVFKFLSVLLVFLFIQGYLFAQRTYKAKAARHESKNHYLDASKVYLGLHSSGDRESLLKGAMNLYKGHQYEEALPYFRKADSLAIIKDEEEVFAYFECLKSVKKYKEADNLINTRSPNFANSREIILQENKMPYYQKLQAFEGAKIQRLNFNTKFSEMSPTVFEGWLYFVSTVPTSGNREVHRINMQPFYNLYAVPLESDMKKMIKPKGSFGQKHKTIKYQSFSAVSLPDAVNRKHHDGPLTVTPSGNVMVYTSNWSKEKRPKGKDVEINLLLYYSFRQNDVWSKPVSVPFNSFDWSNQHGFFDEKDSVLYFSSNKPGGQGSFDIWKSAYKAGTWSDPVNLGPNVNTPKDEVFPSMSPDGTFFFSSNGWPGLGGLDIFLIDDPNSIPLNATATLNTEKDDFGLYFTTNRLANMTSNRISSVGDDDIYGVELDIQKIKEYMRPAPRLITGLVRDASSGAVLDDVKITVGGCMNRKYTTVGGKSLNESVPPGSANCETSGLTIFYEKEGYESKEIKIAAWPDAQQVLDISESLIRKPVPQEERPLVQVRIMENQKFIIYFDFDKFNIRKDAADILAKVAYVLLEEYQAAEVQLTGHTDTRGSLQYNENLSNNRVDMAKKWLIEKGVSAKRIKTNYRGEVQLAVFCKDPLRREQNPDLCLTEAEHQLNRRVEIEILNK